MRDDGDTLLHRGRQVAEKSENAATAFAAVAAPPISRMPLHFRSFGQVSRSGIASCLYLQAPYSCSRNNSASPCRRALGLSFPSRKCLHGGVFPNSCFLCPLYSVWPQGVLLSTVDHDGVNNSKVRAIGRTVISICSLSASRLSLSEGDTYLVDQLWSGTCSTRRSDP
jgi:hypothetical protein